MDDGHENQQLGASSFCLIELDRTVRVLLVWLLVGVML